MTDRPRSGVSRRVVRGVGRGTRWTGRAVRGQVVRRVGGPARARVIVLFASVLALNGADAATVGAVAPQLEASLHINNADIGLLSSVSLLVGAIFTIPVGLFVDRTRRMPLLTVTIVLWSAASLLSAFAGGFSSLLLTRVALGAVAASAGPAIASLTGDYFAAGERGRVWSYILVGEVAGTAFGFIVSGFVASAIDWRAAFVVLAIPGFFLARELYRTVPEPLRGGQSHLQVGTVDLELAVSQAATGADGEDGAAQAEEAPEAAAAWDAARRAGAVPDPERVLHEDPRAMSLAESLRYLFAIPSNVLMIAGSSLGYFFFAGLQTFALLFVKGHYHANQATSELVLALLVIGAVIGTLVGGRLPDVLLKRGDLGARMWFPGVALHPCGPVPDPRFSGEHAHPRRVVRRRRRGVHLSGQPAHSGRPSGRRARGPVGTRAECPDRGPLAGAGGGAARLRRDLSAGGGDRAQPGADRDASERAILQRRHRAGDHVPHPAVDPLCRGLVPVPRPEDVCHRRGHRRGVGARRRIRRGVPGALVRRGVEQMMELAGLELATSWVRSRRSPN